MLSDRLKSLRERLGYTQDEVSELLDVPLVSYRRYENGKASPKPEFIRDFARTFSVSTDYLHGLTNEPNAILSKRLTPRQHRVMDAMDRGDTVAAMRELVAEE